MKNYMVIGNRWSLVGNNKLRQACDIRKALQLAGGNSGNLLIGQSVHRHLMRMEHDASVQYYRMSQMAELERIDLQGYYDALVIPASNMINAGVNWGGLAKFIEKAGLPVIIIGMGAEAGLYEDDIKIPEGSLRFLQVAAEHSVRMGVRGDYTANYLDKLGIHNVQVIGCPSLYWHGEKAMNIQPLPPQDNYRACISVTRDREMYGFTQNLKKVHRDLLAYAMAYDGSYIVQSNFAEAYMSHQQELKEDMLANMQQYFQVPKENLERFVPKGVEIFFNTTEWEAHMSRYDVAIGSRFHGSMMALISGIPAMWITHDVRTRELCDFLGVNQVHVNEVVEQNLSVTDLIERIDYSDFNTHYQRRYAAYKEFMSANGLPLAF